MSGKCRPSLRMKTLENVTHSILSQTDKDCIAKVFARYEKAQAEIDRLTEIEEAHHAQNGELRKEVGEKSKKLREILPIVAELKAEAIKEFAERVKKECFYWDFIARKYRACTDLTHNHIDQIAKEMGVEL